MAKTTDDVLKEFIRESDIEGQKNVFMPEILFKDLLSQSVRVLIKEAHEIAVSKGWHDEPVPIPVALALIHSEVSEALEADRKGDRENFVEELADVCIRIFDLCGLLDIDLQKAIHEKMNKNRMRSYKHGGKAY